MNNGIIERMKAATTMAVDREVRAKKAQLRDPERYRRTRLPQVLAEHRDRWQQMYQENPDVTVAELLEAVGPEAAAVGGDRLPSEASVERMKQLLAEPADIDRNLAGVASAREYLRGRGQTR